MKKYFKQNIYQFKHATLISWIFFFILISVIMLGFAKNPNKLTLIEKLAMCSIFASGMTIFIITISFFSAYYWNVQRIKVYNLTGLKGYFIKHNFNNYLKFEHSKWAFIEEIKEGYINGFKVTADLNQNKLGYITFEFKIQNERRTLERIKELEEIFKKHNSSFGIWKVSKEFKYKKNLTEDEIELTLNNISNIMLNEGIRP